MIKIICNTINNVNSLNAKYIAVFNRTKNEDNQNEFHILNQVKKTKPKKDFNTQIGFWRVKIKQ